MRAPFGCDRPYAGVRRRRNRGLSGATADRANPRSICDVGLGAACKHTFGWYCGRRVTTKLLTEHGAHHRAETPTTTRKRSQTRTKAAATNRSTAAKKAAATRARNQAAEASKRSTAAKKAAETRRELARGPVDRYADLA